MSEAIQDMVRAAAPLSALEKADIHAVANEMASAYKGMVEHFIRRYKKTPQEAFAAVAEMGTSEEWLHQIRETPSREVSWNQLDDLHQHDPLQMVEQWERIKTEAKDYAQTGEMPADVIPNGEPWNRALFIAVRNSLIQEWQPTNGMEQCLIDQLALCQIRFLHWNGYLSTWESWVHQETKDDRMMRISTSEAIERAMNMVDRWNRMFLRTLRALRDLRRFNNPVIVQNAGQVNVGGQQVNIAQPVVPEAPSVP